MKNSIVKKLMVFGLAWTMAVTAVPANVFASGTEQHTEAETKEAETKAAETKETEKKESESGTEAPESETKKPENDTKESEPDQKNTDGREQESEKPVEQVLDGLEVTARADEALKVAGGEEGVDYTFDEETGEIVILKNTKLTISGASEQAKITVQADEANVTLAKVDLHNPDGSVLSVEKGKKLNLTLSKVNSLTAETGSAVAVAAEAELTVKGSGALTLHSEENEADIQLCNGKDAVKATESSAAVEGEKASVVKILDGTVLTASGVGVTEDSEKQKALIQISGGSVNLQQVTNALRKVLNIVGADGKTPVYRAYAVLETTGADTQLGSFEVQVDGKSYTYGCDGIYTDGDSRIWLYLPAKKADVIADYVEFSGVVSASEGKEGTELEKAAARLTIGAVTIPALTYGYETIDNKPVAVVIKNASANGTVLKGAEITGTNKDSFVLHVPADLTVPGRKDGKDGEFSGITICPKPELDAGTYRAALSVTDASGSAVSPVEITFTIDKAIAEAKVKAENKVYDKTRDAEGTVTLTGVRGDIPEIDTSKVTFRFNSANVKDAKEVTVSNLALKDEWAKNYKLDESKLPLKASAKITKAPSEKTTSDLKPPSVTVQYNESKKIWEPKMNTYEGQEYLFFGSLQTSLTENNKKSKNWIYGDKKTKENRIVEFKNNSGLKEGVTYTVWTRFAGTDNYEASEGVYTTFTVPTSGNGSVSEANNQVKGITEGASYRPGSRISFEAVGSGMTTTSPKEGDARYLPVSWKVTEEHSWSSSGPFSAAFSMSQTGNYTLQVKFQKQIYRSGSWQNDGSAVTKNVNFRIDTNGQNGTGYTPSTGNNGSTGTSTSTNRTTTTAAKTGDETPILPLVIALGVAALVLIGFAVRKKKQPK